MLYRARALVDDAHPLPWRVSATAHFLPHFLWWCDRILHGNNTNSKRKVSTNKGFIQEISEYLLLVNTSGITLSILGIVKEVITLLLAHHLHGDRLTSINLAGLSLCVAGMVVHSVSKHSRKKVPTRMTSSALNPLIAVEHEDRKILLVS